MIPSLKKALEVLGLSAKQNLVLGVLLENGPMLVAAVAKAAKLNRTTTYDIVRDLSARGLVSQIKKGGAVRYQAIEPEMLPAYFERQRTVLEESKKQVTELLPQLRLLRTRGKAVVRVQYFEGREGIKQAYEDSVRNNKGKVMYGFLGADTGLELMGREWINAYVKSRVAQGVRARTVATDNPRLREFKKLDPEQMRVMKLLPPGYAFDLEMVTYDDKVLITSFIEEHPLSVMIEDQEIAKFMRAIFAYVDSTLTE